MTTTEAADRPLAIRPVVRGAYDIQKIRIQTGNRVAANFRARLGQAPSERADEALDADKLELLADLKRRHRRITDAIIGHKRRGRRGATTEEVGVSAGEFPGDELISTFTDYALVSSYVELESVEEEHFKRLGRALEEVPIWREFLSKVRGVGPAMGGVIVSEIDISHPYVSSLWAYAGLDVGPDGRGRSRRREHLVRRKYVDRDGADAERDSITYNPFLKTKLMGVLGPSFLRLASPYADHYYSYRHRIETDPARVMVDAPAVGTGAPNEWSKMRRHRAATRYMVKRFLADLYVAWRTLEGLPVTEEYSVAKQGHAHRERAA